MSHNAGRSNPRAILTEPEVLHARNLARAGARVRELAALFGARGAVANGSADLTPLRRPIIPPAMVNTRVDTRKAALLIGCPVATAEHRLRRLRRAGLVRSESDTYQLTLDGQDWLHANKLLE